ncbi:methylated-DNA--[protein]-cysteine S-methyltransferase [Sunxiuqinia sp. A32]|uniref:methylated-DNA--[protein]-cysteine S-methyltransferase n=1 Tax=Sunxiuqinia sp. A32 TaxID=3461496 RepID=UPI004045D8CB
MIEVFSYHSPIGYLNVEIKDNHISKVSFSETPLNNDSDSSLKERIFLQLDEYFDGDRQQFELPLAPEGTEFQKNVWEKLEKIPYDSTTMYLDLAISLGDKKKIRAVGGANSKNPIAVIIPCHRVIGANNKLIGYAGGLWRKKWLLEHELKHNPIKRTLF